MIKSLPLKDVVEEIKRQLSKFDTGDWFVIDDWEVDIPVAFEQAEDNPGTKKKLNIQVIDVQSDINPELVGKIRLHFSVNAVKVGEGGTLQNDYNIDYLDIPEYLRRKKGKPE